MARRIRVSASTLRKWGREGVPEEGAAREKLERYALAQKLARALPTEQIASAFGVSERTAAGWPERGIPAARVEKAEAKLAGLRQAKQLARAVKEKGRARVAKSLDISPKTLDGWVRRGVPERRQAETKAYVRRPPPRPPVVPPPIVPVTPAAGQRELEWLMEQIGTVARIARGVERSEATVRRWFAEGLPERGDARQLVAGFVALVKAVKKRSKADLETFRDMLKRRGRDPEGKLRAAPRIYTKDEQYRGRQVSGWRWTRGWNKLLTPQLHAKILAWIDSIRYEERARYPIWQCVAVVSLFGETAQKRKVTVEDVGGRYNTITVQIMTSAKTQRASKKYALRAEVSTMSNTSLVAVRDHMDRLLQDAIDEGLYLFVHATTLFNYRRRTEEQRKEFQRDEWRRRKEEEREWEKERRTKKPKRRRKKRRKRARKATKSPKRRSAPRLAKMTTRMRRARRR